MKHKKLIVIMLSLLMIINLSISIFALDTSEYYLSVPPNDLGVYEAHTYTGYSKYYIYIDLNNFVQSDTLPIRCRYYNDNQTVVQSSLLNVEINLENNTLRIYSSAINSEYYFIIVPQITIDINSRIYYIPVYCYNCGINNYSSSPIRWYLSSTTDITTIQREAFRVGYENGYYDGYLDGIPAGAGILEDLNFVENIEMLIGKFTGDDYAQYITPIAIVLAILLVYFIFIRFLLSLIKAKGVIKVCDIVTLVACISILVVMYLPMIDFTITQHQLVEQIYSVAADVTP